MLTQYLTQPVSYDLAALCLRLAIGLALLPFAIKKFITRKEAADHFDSVFSFSPGVSFHLAMLIEGLGALCMIFGLFTRLMAIPAIVNMAVATNVTRGKYLTSPAQVYLLGFIAILITGPGKYSLDWLIF